MIAIFALREILRLLLSHVRLNFHRIGEITGHPHQTICNINKKLKQASVSWDEIKEMTDDEVMRAIYPKKFARYQDTAMPDFKEIVKECKKKHKNRKTIMLMYIEYKARYGRTGYERAQFYKLVKEHIKANKVVMKQVYLPGEILFIDYAGLTLNYSLGSSDVKLYVFVACLGYSKRIFAFATPDMTSISWCRSLVKSLEYFGGVPNVVQFDNAKAMVKTPGQVAEYHHHITELSQHYNLICDTSRVATPTDNGAAEEAVKFVTQRVIVPMKNDLSFFSLDEVNDYLRSEIDKLNDLHFQNTKVSRNSLFFADEEQELAKLAARPFEPILFSKEIQTPANYLVRYKGNEYSVPFELAHKRIRIKVKGNFLYIVHQGKVRAVHDLIDGNNQLVRKDEHLKPEHKAELAKTQNHYIAWAKQVGKNTVLIVREQYRGFKNPNSRLAGKYCSRLKRLCRRYGRCVFEQACTYAFSHDLFSTNDIELILKAKPFVDEKVEESLTHQNIRGAQYYKEGHRDD